MMAYKTIFRFDAMTLYISTQML